MTRPLVAVALLALLALPAVASAQPGPTVVVGPPIVGGRMVTAPPITNGPSALFPVEVYVPPRFSVGGGSMGAPPKVYVPSGAWSTLNYPWPVVPVLIVENAPAAPTARAHRRVSGVSPLTVGGWSAVSGESVATLVVQFPAAAEIWVGGRKREDTATEWTLSSPALKPGESHTFEVRGRWKAGGKTFEAIRSLTVKAGDRNRAIIVSGTEAR
jgi:uncharacterized protein (TIGR03000 family)